MAPDARSKKTRRRQRGEGSIYQRCDKQYGCPPMETVTVDGKPKRVRPDHKCKGQWMGVIDLGYVDGKRKRVPVSARTQAQAVKRLREMRETLARTGGELPDRRLTVEQWLTYWLQEIAPKKPNTYRFHEMNVNHVTASLGKIKLSRLTTDDVRRLHKDVAGKTWRGKPLSSTTVMHVHGTLRTALDAALRESPAKVERNVAELVKPPGRAVSDRGALTSAQARTLMVHSAESGDPMWTRWVMALFTGARQGECLGLEWDRVDLEQDVVDLSWGLDELRFRHGCGPRRTAGAKPGPDSPESPYLQGSSARRTAPDSQGWPCGRTRAGSCPERVFDVPPEYEYRPLDGRLALVRLKTEASKRVVPLVPPLKAALYSQRELYVGARSAYESDHGLVWCRPDGRPVVGKDDSTAWKEACRAAGLPVLDLHAARHTTATLLLDAGVDQRIVQQIVGHSSAAMTAKYQHVDTELARRGLQAMADLIALPKLGKLEG